jgi:hypothetical protein
MKDDDLESLLRGYRPLGPPAELRERVVAATMQPRVWPWVAAAAAVFAATVLLHGATGRLVRQSPLAGGPPPSQDVVDLTDALGGGDRARAAAEIMVGLDRAARDLVAIGTSGQEASPRD